MGEAVRACVRAGGEHGELSAPCPRFAVNLTLLWETVCDSTRTAAALP